jgi:hypothetical protein
LGNAKLLHALSQQLGTPRKAALETANELLDTHLVCTLGGQYQLVSEEGAVPYWRSTGTSTAASSPRSDFEAPLLQWFRGLDLEVTKTPDRLLLRADITMQRKPTSSPWSLPFLNLLDGKKKGEEPKSTDKRKPSG